MESLQLIEKFLQKYEYPTIYTADLSDILSVLNRKFLLSWLYGLLQEEPSEETLPDDILIDFLNVYGFCKSSETSAFLSTELDYPLQLEILIRIFKFLDILKRNQEIDDIVPEVSIERLQNLENKDLNIFKSLGPIQLEETDKRAKIKDKIQENNNEEIDFKNAVEKISKIEENLQSAIDLIHNILKFKSCDNSNCEIGLEDGLNVLKEFNREVLKATDYIQKVQFLSEYSDKLDTLYMDIQKYENVKIMKMVKETIQLIHEVNQM